MNTDNIMLLSSFLIFWLILTVLIIVSDRKLKRALYNLVPHLIYSFYFLYGLYYDSEGGTALAWFLYLLFIIWIHLIINFGQLIYLLIKKRKRVY